MSIFDPPKPLAQIRPQWLSRFSPYDVAAALLLIGISVIAFVTLTDYAITNDEEVQQRYGELIISYYTSGFTDHRVFTFENLYLYGGLFDVMATLLATVLPFDLYTVRHILCVLTGIGGIAATWAIARLIAGPRAGLIAIAVLAVCGIWYGTMFHHTKDIPFAAAMIGALFFLLRLARDLPRPRVRDVVLFGLLMGAALGIRVMGLLLVGYAGLAGLLQLMRSDAVSLRERLAFIVRSTLAIAPAFVIGYLIMIAAWPWAALAPLNPIRGLLDFSHFDYQIPTLLAGKVYDMAQVPRWYIPEYILIKLPLLIFVGAALAIAFACVERWSQQTLASRARWEIGFIAFTAAFPVLCQVIGRGPAFSGMRHFIFVVPPLAVLAGIGFDLLLTSLQRWRPIAAAAAGAVIVAALAWEASILVRLHPYQYLYYNALVGGLKGAAERYDTDYWVTIIPEAVQGIEAIVSRAIAAGQKPPFMVAICGERIPFEKVASPRLQWLEKWEHSDFFIAPTHMGCHRHEKADVIIRIERFGTLIGVVKDRRPLSRPGSPPVP